MFERILIPVDGTKGSEKAIPFALEQAQAHNAEVVVCYVITTPLTARSPIEEQNAAKYVTKIAETFHAEGIVARAQVRRGDPHMEINKAANDWGADGIVMATRSRRRVERLMLGSVADLVVRDSSLPVLLVSSRHRLKKSRRRRAA